MTKWHWGFWPAILFTALGRARAAARHRRGQPAGRRDRLCDGDARLRPGRLGARLQEPRPADGRRGRVRGRLHEAARGLRRDLQHEEPRTGSRSGTWWSSSSIGRWAVASSPGHVWQAIRENELRVEVLGLRPYWFKLMSFVLASFLATMGGVVYLIVISGASPSVTTPNFTLALLVMVVIGGAGSAWGAVIGGLCTPTSTTGSATSRARTRSRRCRGPAHAARAAAVHPRARCSSSSSTSRRAGSRGCIRIRRRPAALEEAL